MSTSNDKDKTSNLPFIAPCKKLGIYAPINWLELAWQDIKRAPRQSLSYGAALVGVSYVFSFLVWLYGGLGLLVGLLSGFLLLGPILALGLYSISCQIQSGVEPQLGYCMREGKRHLGNELIFAIILSVIFLVWARAAIMTHVLYPDTSNASWTQYVPFFTVGTFEGMIFSFIIFCFSAFSLPMIMDRKVDVITAIITSINAVLRNWSVSILWAGIIVFLVTIGFATAFLGFIIIMPLLGHATWHAYKETINAEQWPRHKNIDEV